jgi:hypothetical protein
MTRKHEGAFLALALVGFLVLVGGAIAVIAVGPSWLQGIVIAAAGAFAIWGRAAFAQIGLGHHYLSLRPPITVYAVVIGALLIVYGCVVTATSL